MFGRKYEVQGDEERFKTGVISTNEDIKKLKRYEEVAIAKFGDFEEVLSGEQRLACFTSEELISYARDCFRYSEGLIKIGEITFVGEPGERAKVVKKNENNYTMDELFFNKFERFAKKRKRLKTNKRRRKAVSRLDRKALKYIEHYAKPRGLEFVCHYYQKYLETCYIYEKGTT
ncbi:MAG: hypothetical protein ABIH37_04535 [archaeon]